MRSTELVLHAAENRVFNAHLAEPDRTPAPGVLLLQEIFGVNGIMRRSAEHLARAGYLVAVPDLFWRQKEGVQLDPDSEADRQSAMQYYKAMDEALAVEDCIAALDHLRGLPQCTGKVAAIGYCMGGKLAYLMATRSNVDAAVGYYGVGIHAALGEARLIRKPLMLHIAGADQLCPPAAQQAIVDALKECKSLVTLHTYEGVGHAFARRGGATFDSAAAHLAEQRTGAFLAQALS